MLLAWLWACACAAQAPGGARVRAGEPAAIAIDSPAWAELMALPVPLPGGEALPFYAADLIQTWGRPEEAEALRRALLHLHLRRVVGGPEPAVPDIRALWAQLQAQPLSDDDLAAAHELALARSLRLQLLSFMPPGLAESGLKPLGPAAPGFVADAAGSVLGAHLRVSNAGPALLAPQALSLTLREGELGVTLQCSHYSQGDTIFKGRHLDWWCVQAAPAPALLQALRAGRGPRLSSEAAIWSSPALRDAGSVQNMARAMRDAPPAWLREFISRNASCERQGTCRRVERPQPSAADVQRAAEAQRRAVEQSRRERDRFDWWALAPWGYLAVAIGVHVLVARRTAAFPAIVLSLLTGPALAALLWRSDRSWGEGWGLLLGLLPLAFSGVLVASLGHVIYKRNFADD